MLYNIDVFSDAFYKKLAEVLQLPDEVSALLDALYGKLGELPKLQKRLFKKRYSALFLKTKTARAAKKRGVHPYTFDFYLLFVAAKRLHALYEKKCIDQEIFWDTVKDLKYKLNECFAVHAVWGTFVFDWFAGFYRLTRFCLGRFQYDITKYYARKPYKKHGFCVMPCQTVYSCHIPSSGPLTKQDALDSYKKAFDFFCGGKTGGTGFCGKNASGADCGGANTSGAEKNTIVIVCDSWLLYPPHREFLPPNSGILAFMDDWDIISHKEDSKFQDAWRIFGAEHTKPYQELPQNTGLQRAYARRLQSGKPTGTGFGILIFDGESIVNVKTDGLPTD